MSRLSTVTVNTVEPQCFQLGTNVPFETSADDWPDEEPDGGTREIASIAVYTPESPLLDRLCDLRFEDMEDDYGRLRPTEQALSTALNLIRRTEADFGTLPVGSVSTDSEGGIRITWLGGQHQAQVICPADSNNAHLYFEHGDDYGMDHEVTSTTLIDHLRLAGWA
jgi:hypothetical protein